MAPKKDGSYSMVLVAILIALIIFVLLILNARIGRSVQFEPREPSKFERIKVVVTWIYRTTSRIDYIDLERFRPDWRRVTNLGDFDYNLGKSWEDQIPVWILLEKIPPNNVGDDLRIISVEFITEII